MQKKGSAKGMLALIIAGEAIFLLPFIVMRVFKPIIRDVFLVSDAQIGEAQALYGITALISYFFGGFIADRFPPRLLLCFSLLLTALGGLWLAMIPNIIGLRFLYAFWGVSTIMFFWASLIKATRQWGTKNNQGFSFGLLDGGRGLFAALVALSGASILTFFYPNIGVEITFENKKQSLQLIIVAITILVFLTVILVYTTLPKTSSKEILSTNKFNFGKAIQLIRQPKVWYHSLIIFCAYCAYKLTGVYGTYARDVWQFSLEKATFFAVGIQCIRPISTISSGFFADRFVSSRVLIPVFLVMAGLSLLLGLKSYEAQYINIYVLVFVSMAFATYSLRGLYFAIIAETNTPLQKTGTLVGIISVVGFTPDIFMSLFNGYMLGKNPTITEYQNLFLYFTCIPIIGLIASLCFRKSIKK